MSLAQQLKDSLSAFFADPKNTANLDHLIDIASKIYDAYQLDSVEDPEQLVILLKETFADFFADINDFGKLIRFIQDPINRRDEKKFHASKILQLVLNQCVESNPRFSRCNMLSFLNTIPEFINGAYMLNRQVMNNVYQYYPPTDAQLLDFLEEKRDQQLKRDQPLKRDQLFRSLIKSEPLTLLMHLLQNRSAHAGAEILTLIWLIQTLPKGAHKEILLK